MDAPMPKKNFTNNFENEIFFKSETVIHATVDDNARPALRRQPCRYHERTLNESTKQAFSASAPGVSMAATARSIGSMENRHGVCYPAHTSK
jgi:hypothetical protein